MSARDNRSMNERHNEIVEELKAHTMTTKEATARPNRTADIRKHCDEIERNGFDPLKILPQAEATEVLQKAWRAQNDCLILLEDHDTLTEENARLSIRVKEMEEALRWYADGSENSGFKIVDAYGAFITTVPDFLSRARNALSTASTICASCSGTGESQNSLNDPGPCEHCDGTGEKSAARAALEQSK